MNMNHHDDIIEYKKSLQKMKVLAIFGCLSTILIGMIVTAISAWLLWGYIWTPGVKELQVSHSPNNENIITIYQVNEFPDPILKIEYGDQEITKTKIPDKITIEWENDVKAQIMLHRNGEDDQIEYVQFE